MAVERKEVVVSVPVMKAPRWLQGFLNFVREQGVVSLAIGLTIGVAAKSVVDSIVANILNPIIGLAGAGGSLENKFVCLKTVNGSCTNKLGYGHVLSDILSFILIAAIIYFVVKGLKLDKLDRKKEE